MILKAYGIADKCLVIFSYELNESTNNLIKLTPVQFGDRRVLAL